MVSSVAGPVATTLRRCCAKTLPAALLFALIALSGRIKPTAASSSIIGDENGK